MRHPQMVRLVLAAVVVSAFVAGVLAPGPMIADPELRTLLRFMAVIKGAMAVAAVVLVDWRFRSPSSWPTGVAAIAGAALMAGGAGLIWSLSWVAAGAVLFHAGLLGLLVLAWRDGLPSRLPRRFGLLLAPRAAHQRAATGTATSFLLRNGNVHGGS